LRSKPKGPIRARFPQHYKRADSQSEPYTHFYDRYQPARHKHGDSGSEKFLSDPSLDALLSTNRPSALRKTFQPRALKVDTDQRARSGPPWRLLQNSFADQYSVSLSRDTQRQDRFGQRVWQYCQFRLHFTKAYYRSQ